MGSESTLEASTTHYKTTIGTFMSKSDKAYGQHGSKSPGGKGAKKKDLIKQGLPVNWVNQHDPDAARRNA